MTARAVRIANSVLLSLFQRFASRTSPRRSRLIRDIDALDDHMLKDIGLRRLEQRKPHCLGDYHPKVLAISLFGEKDKPGRTQ